MRGCTRTSSLIKEAEVHESLGTHIIDPPSIANTRIDYTLAICSSCHHILIYKNGKWKAISKEEVWGISEYDFLENYPDKDKVISVYEKYHYFDVPCFAFYFTRDITKKKTRISKALAQLDDVYDFHYKNEIEGRSTPEAAKEFQRLLKKKLEF